MRRMYLFMSLSLDGYFEGPNHDISWHHVDEEFNKFVIEQLKHTDLFLWGRRVYQLMEAYWPKAAENPSTSEDNLEIADLMNSTEKLVFSRTLDRVEETKNWESVRLVHEFDPAEIQSLKERSGEDIVIGGPDLASSFIRAGLVDELRFMINPVALGEGAPIFRGMERMNLQLLRTRKFESGNILLCYKPSQPLTTAQRVDNCSTVEKAR
jgi:dihydrofolate reductase